MSGGPYLVYRSQSGIAPEQARDARVRAWTYVFDCYRKNEATRPGGPDAEKGSKHDSRHLKSTP